ncbi:MAG: prolyl oligopeptidase family serine peptidase, partial [Victivallales bacterium]
GKVPAIVLVHGGSGTAYAEWVRLWNARGYAAIAMDLCGSVPIRSPDGSGWLKIPRYGGPDGWQNCFGQISEPLADQWPYYAVNAIGRARTFLGKQPEIDASKIGITGVSWGAYLTCLVAGIDTRFAFAVPVYGCGFFRDGKTASGNKLTGEAMDRWTLQCDPSSYFSNVKMPTLWVDGTNDSFFPMEAVKMSYSSIKAPVTLSQKVRMTHSHGGPGERPEEIFAFADSFCSGGKPLAAFAGQGFSSREAWVSFKSEVPLESAELVFTRDTGPNKDRKWESEPAKLDAASGKASAAIPEGTKLYYFNVIDSRKLSVSSPFVEFKQ